jgi:hypothetical protein
MFEFLKSKSFHVIGSFIVGFGLVAAIFRPGCANGTCTVMKAPKPDEVAATTYQLGSKCYQFKTEPTECAASGVVEPFQCGCKV